MYTQDAVDLVEYIGALVCSKHTSGMWSNGLAVYDFYMESFGVSEGEDAVLEFLQHLDIVPDGAKQTILGLAFKMLVNNAVPDRCLSIL